MIGGEFVCVCVHVCAGRCCPAELDDYHRNKQEKNNKQFSIQIMRVPFVRCHSKECASLLGGPPVVDHHENWPWLFRKRIDEKAGVGLILLTSLAAQVVLDGQGIEKKEHLPQKHKRATGHTITDHASVHCDVKGIYFIFRYSRYTIFQAIK